MNDMHFAPEKRYQCRDCCDTGWVTIWHPATIRQAIKDPNTTVWRTCVVGCTTCDKMANHGGKLTNGREIPFFGEQPWHINAHHHNAKLEAAAYEHKPENYNAEFEHDAT